MAAAESGGTAASTGETFNQAKPSAQDNSEAAATPIPQPEPTPYVPDPAIRETEYTSNKLILIGWSLIERAANAAYSRAKVRQTTTFADFQWLANLDSFLSDSRILGVGGYTAYCNLKKLRDEVAQFNHLAVDGDSAKEFITTGKQLEEYLRRC